MVAKSAEFEKASEEVKTLAKKPDQKTQLELYALYKHGNGLKVEEPSGFMDFEGKHKYAAWKKEQDAGTTSEQAQKKYVELVEKLKKEIGTK